MLSKKFICSICSYQTDIKYNFNRHMMSKHSNNNCKNTVIDCKNTVIDCKNTVIDTKNTVIDCKNTVIDNIDTKCFKCSKILSSKYYLQKHILICKGVLNPLECYLCNKILYDSSSKSKHLKICKGKQTDLIEYNKKEEEIISLQHSIINNTSNTQLTLNNNCNYTTNNITYNINLISFNEEELKIDFDITHFIDNIVYKLYIIAHDDAFRLFYKKLFENKNNQLIIKKNLKHTYSKVHTGFNIWQQMLDDYIYHIIMHFISETLLLYLYNNAKDKDTSRYTQLRDYAEIMACKGYSNKNTKQFEKSYKNHIKSLKFLFNTF